jgi:glycosyltransferase involved in cell wall biosynthesis
MARVPGGQYRPPVVTAPAEARPAHVEVVSEPRVSVLFPLFKSKQFLDNLITHLDRFTSSDAEVIVSDRHCHDDTISILQKRYEGRSNFRFLAATDGAGWVEHFNALIAAASGKYFSLVFHDDEYPADYFDVLVAELERQPSALLAFGHMHADGDTEWVIDSTLFRAPHEFPFPTTQYLTLLYSNLLGIAFRGVFRTAPIQQARLFIRSNGAVTMFQDYYWIFALLTRGDFVFTDRTSCRKVFRKSGASGDWDYARFFKTNRASRQMIYGYTLTSRLPARTKAGICAGIEARVMVHAGAASMRAARALAGRALRALKLGFGF